MKQKNTLTKMSGRREIGKIKERRNRMAKNARHFLGTYE